MPLVPMFCEQRKSPAFELVTSGFRAPRKADSDFFQINLMGLESIKHLGLWLKTKNDGQSLRTLKQQNSVRHWRYMEKIKKWCTDHKPKVLPSGPHKTFTGGRVCGCGEKFESGEPKSINPWAQTCGTSLPEHDARDVVENNGGFIWDGTRPLVDKIVSLCKENSSLFASSNSSSGKTLAPNTAPDSAGNGAAVH